MTATMIPYVVEGEIIRVNETPAESAGSSIASAAMSVPGSNQIKKRQIVSYTCRVEMPYGSDIILPNVIDGSFFGGIDDYFQIRRRSTEDGSSFSMGDANNMSAHIGDRVYIAFIGGNITRPIILSGAQHPNQINRFEDGVSQDETSPQMFMRYLGVSFVIDYDGQFSLTHFGAPDIVYTGTDNLTGSVPSGLLEPSGGYEDYSDSDANDSPNNKAVKMQSYKYKTTMEFLKDGTWAVRDSIGQGINVNPADSTLTITNAGMTSLDDPTSFSPSLSLTGEPDAETIVFDKAEKSILISARDFLYVKSTDAREDTTGGDYSHDITGGESITIGGDQSVDVTGGVTRSIMSDLDETVSGSASWSVLGDYSFDITGGFTVDSKGDVGISAIGDITIEDMTGSGIKVSGGKVEVGGAAAGIFDTMSNVLDQLDKLITQITSLTVGTSLGPSSPPLNAAAFAPIQVQLATFKAQIDIVKGSL